MFIFSLIALFCISGCSPMADSSNGRHYSSRDVGVAMVSELGTVVQRRQVTIDGKPGGGRLTGVGTGVGVISGAALGATIADRAGPGALAGGVVGGIIGTAIEGVAKSQGGGAPGLEYTIKLSKSGKIITVLQPASVDLSVGQRVVVFQNQQNNTVRLEPIAYVDI